MSAPRLEELLARETPKLLQCVHCGLCLDECPTYRTTGDEANSPRGRLALWRAESEGRLAPGPETDAYTDLCVGCLACVTACPANVPYGDLLMARRASQARRGAGPGLRVRALAPLLRRPRLMNALAFPLRQARRLGLKLHRLMPPGPAPVWEGTASYARRVNAALKPSGPEVALLAGCLTEAVFRELNAATVRVLALNGFRVAVPEGQACCGAVAEHGGLEHEKGALDAANRRAFEGAAVILTNASGCGLSLRRAVGDRQRDLVDFLEALPPKPGAPQGGGPVWYDIPCHAYHGLGLTRTPAALMEAAGYGGRWKPAPEADRCCGAGGAYAALEPESSLRILREKEALLGPLPPGATLVTANPVCMAQWAQIPGLKVLHAAQALDESYKKAGFYSALG